jgi:hypothetical protein
MVCTPEKTGERGAVGIIPFFHRALIEKTIKLMQIISR